MRVETRSSAPRTYGPKPRAPEAPLPELPRFSASDLDVAACRKLWRYVLIDQFRLLQGRMSSGGRVWTGKRRTQQLIALGWFSTGYFERVCEMAGVEPETARAAARRIAIERGLA